MGSYFHTDAAFKKMGGGDNLFRSPALRFKQSLETGLSLFVSFLCNKLLKNRFFSLCILTKYSSSRKDQYLQWIWLPGLERHCIF